MPETISAQELFCHLQDYRLQAPNQDQWESFQGPIQTWVDCWFGGATAHFNATENTLEVVVEEKTIITMEYHPDDEYAIHIETLNDDGELEGDAFSLLTDTQ